MSEQQKAAGLLALAFAESLDKTLAWLQDLQRDVRTFGTDLVGAAEYLEEDRKIADTPIMEPQQLVAFMEWAVSASRRASKDARYAEAMDKIANGLGIEYDSQQVQNNRVLRLEEALGLIRALLSAVGQGV